MENFTSLEQIENKANELFKQYGFIDWKFKFDNAKVRMGQCRHSRYTKVGGTISMSRALCLHNMGKPKLMDTLLHEFAHGLAWIRTGVNHGHDNVWASICIEIGANPQRCYTEDQIDAVASKYEYKCPCCGEISNKHKRLRRRTACGDCCRTHNFGRFSEKYVLFLDKQNW